MMLPRLIASIAIVAFATPTVSAQGVSPIEINDFLVQVKSCWALMPEDIASGRKVTVRLDLRIDGEVDKIAVVSSDKSAAGRSIAASAVRALERCAPYSFSAESYEHWKTLKIDLQP